MIRSRFLVRGLAAAVLALAAFPGCMKLKTRATIYPDGAGRLTFSMAMKKDMLEMAKAQSGKDEDPTDMDPLKIEETFKGFVAFTEPKKTEDDEWVTTTVTGYFEDANKVVVAKKGPGESDGGAMHAFTFKKEGDGFVLSDGGGMLKEMKPQMSKVLDENASEEEKAQMEQQMAMIGTMADGLEFRMEIEMPGNVSKAPNHRSSEGRVAAFFFTIEDLTDEAKRKEFGTFMNKTEAATTVTCGKSEVSDADTAAFKVELAKAKVEWEKILAAAKAKAAAGATPAGPATPAPAPAADPAPAGK